MNDADQHYKTQASIFRILGNENLPRDIPGKRLEILKRICEKEPNFPNTQKWFVVNKIYSKPYRRTLLETLDRYNAHYITQYFDWNCKPHLHALRTWGLGVNQARNIAIQAGKYLSRYAVILDGDCMFTPDGWEAVYQDIQQEQYPYLSIPSKRENTEQLGECMVAFRDDSTLQFNPGIPFGDKDKLSLLYSLGHATEASDMTVDGDLTKISGYVNHLTTGSLDLELSLFARERARNQSLQRLVNYMQETPHVNYQVTGSLMTYYERIPGYFDFAGPYHNFVLDMPDNGHFVEVGTWYGRSVIYLANQFKAFGKRVRIDCVDTWDGGTDPVLKAQLAQEKGDLFSIFINHVKATRNQDIINPVRLLSIEAAKQYEDNSLDVVFIDADHSYKSVMEDLQAWYPKVKPGGVIAGHDFSFDPNFAHPGVTRAVLEFFQDKPLEILPAATSWKSVKYGKEPLLNRKRFWS